MGSGLSSPNIQWLVPNFKGTGLDALPHWLEPQASPPFHPCKRHVDQAVDQAQDDSHFPGLLRTVVAGLLFKSFCPFCYSVPF